MKAKVLLIVVLAFPVLLFAEPWRAELRWQSGDYHGRLEFGADPLGSDAYNDTLDIPIPLAPPGDEPFAYFSINDPRFPYFTMLERDIRWDQSDTIIFTVEFRGRTNMIFSWEPSLLPQGEFGFGIAFLPNRPTSYENMRTYSTATVLPGQALYIRYIPTEYRLSLPPYFSDFIPNNGETGVSVVSPLSFSVFDRETGVNRNSIRVYINGIDVTSNIILTEIDYGYSVRYIHAEPFDGARRYVVTIYASDFAYPPHNASISIEFTTGAELERAQFEFPLFVWTKVEDDSIVQTLSLGLDPVCGAGYDIGYDLPVPAIPPLAPYAYFIISDSEYPFISMLSRDIRNSGEPAHIWKIRVDNSGANCGLVWFPEFMLEGWIFEIGKGTFDLPPAERDFVNMREISHYEFRRGDVIYIRASATPEIDWTPPRIINFYPPDGATNIIVNTRISCDIVDYESGVDRSSIMMWVQGENVSSRLSITEIPYGYNVVYQPVEPLPFLSRITVIVSANDLSYLRNAASDTVSFRTGSVLAPAWTETLYIGVTNETLDTVRMQLIIGLDEYGTDGFDFALDAVLPPPPPFGPYAFLIIEDTVWNVLGQDIRWIYDDDVEWKATLINFPQSGEGAAWVSWDRNMLTPEGNFIITAWRSSTIIGRANMRETDRFNLFGATSFTIRKFFGATSFCIIGRITLDGAERHDNTIIRLLDTEFADTTDDDGSFTICDVPTGVYTISIVHQGYEQRLIENFALVSDTTLNLTLTPILYTVDGYITLSDTPYYDGTVVTLGDRTSSTDSSGYFIFADVPTGEYRFTATHTRYASFDTTLFVNHNITINRELQRLVFSFCGSVLDESGEPLVGVPVEVFTLDFHDTSRTTTDDYGRFCVENLYSGWYIVWILGYPGYADTTDTVEIVSNIERTYELRRLKGRIYGHCTLEDVENHAGSFVVLNERDTVITDNSGYYEFSDLEIPNTYLLSFRHDNYVPFDTSVYIAVSGDVEVNVTLHKLPAPRNLRAINGLHERIPLEWDPPEELGLHPLKYRIYRAFPPFSSYALIAETPYTCNAYIDRDVTDYYAYQYVVTVVYDEGESGRSNWAIGYPRPNPEHPEVLVYDFDNGGRFIQGEFGAEHYITTYLSVYGLNYTLTPQDTTLDTYNLLEYELVIICTGVFDENNRRMRNDDIIKLTKYLLAGGRIYWEGADAGYTYYFQGDEVSRNFFGLFGVNFEFDGFPYSEGNVRSIRGNADFFGRDINVSYAYRTMADQFIDELSADIATPILWSQTPPEPSRSSIRATAFETETYRTVLSSVYIGAMASSPFPNTGSYVFGKYLQFLLRGVTPVNEKETYIPKSFDVTLYPNPFNAELTAEIELPAPGEVEFKVFDILGRTVHSAYYQFERPGSLSLKWDTVPENLPSGVYFISITYKDKKVLHKVILMK